MIGGLELACGGAAQLVRLIGEAGIGKTRLVDEFLARARRGQTLRRRRDPAGYVLAAGRAILRRSCCGVAQRLPDRSQRVDGRDAREGSAKRSPSLVCRAARSTV